MPRLGNRVEELKAPCFDVSKIDKHDQGMFGVTYMSSKIREMMRILKTREPGQKTIVFVSNLKKTRMTLL